MISPKTSCSSFKASQIPVCPRRHHHSVCRLLQHHLHARAARERQETGDRHPASDGSQPFEHCLHLRHLRSCDGILSSIIGATAALFTLHHIDSIVRLLSYFQGHDAFNATFFGQSLSSELSNNAVTFILIATPLISLLAGLVPAIKACRLRPSEILRSE